MMTLFIRITAGHGSVASNSVGRPCHVGRESRRRSLKPQSSSQFGLEGRYAAVQQDSGVEMRG